MLAEKKQKVMLKGKIIIQGKINCETGLRIGGARETLEIGGLENIIIRDALTNEPYIPGSSLKGKMRSLLEKAYGKEIDIEKGKDIHTCSDPKCKICRVFGVPAEETEKAAEGLLLTRLYMRDGRLTEESKKKLDERKEELEVPYGEVKWENVINRLTSKANPRQVERVPAGSSFDFDMVYNIYEDEDISYLKHVFEAQRLVEDDYLGGYGSRGYGKVNFSEIKIRFNSLSEVYKMGNDGKIIREGKTPKELLKEFDKIKEELEKEVKESSKH
ncbi:MAG: type III-A CRISPR-associated RAMP protein Csm3 [archaeon]|nr:type III-A CRISPR-associated RAMP protein Csm3 [archaeon]MCP8314838.1 type III-A CRISPR-associated RAMP protein Csm3 [archaeon]